MNSALSSVIFYVLIPRGLNRLKFRRVKRLCDPPYWESLASRAFFLKERNTFGGVGLYNYLSVSIYVIELFLSNFLLRKPQIYPSVSSYWNISSPGFQVKRLDRLISCWCHWSWWHPTRTLSNPSVYNGWSLTYYIAVCILTYYVTVFIEYHQAWDSVYSESFHHRSHWFTAEWKGGPRHFPIVFFELITTPVTTCKENFKFLTSLVSRLIKFC